MGINVLEIRAQREYLFYLFYLCSFSHGGRGTEATVLLLRRCPTIVNIPVL